MSSQPYNQSTQDNPVGRFMVAVGGIIELNQTGKILLVQRSADLDWQPNQWEVLYGRIDQFEDAETGLKRETKEETGLENLEIVDVLSVWHIFRGTEETAENELIGITYRCRTNQEQPTLSKEHQGFKWVTPQEALELVQVEGIKKDIEKFMARKNS